MPVAVASNSTANILTLKMKSYGYAPLVRIWVSSNDVPTLILMTRFWRSAHLGQQQRRSHR